MPPSPDAQSLRLRRPTAVDKSVTDNDEATVPRVSELKDLAGKEVVIDGVIYDLTDFKHPGGDSVLIFGGNDVTVQYRMIHPYHTKKHLEKMRMVNFVTCFFIIAGVIHQW